MGSKKSEVDSANASGTQALTLRGLSNPGVMRMGVQFKKKKKTTTYQRNGHKVAREFGDDVFVSLKVVKKGGG